MNRFKQIFILIGITCFIVIGGILYVTMSRISIKKVTLSSPDNSAIKEKIEIVLEQPAVAQVEYWKEGEEDQKLVTEWTESGKAHQITLLFLEPQTTYHYKINLKKVFRKASKTFSFQTRKQSFWLEPDWVKEDKPHDATALDGGLVMIPYRGSPGYIAMVDGKGVIRWHWQEPNGLGVRLATFTSKKTILALLAPADKDQFQEKKEQVDSVKNHYIRTGKMGYVGGSEIVEIDLEGNELWRINIADKNLILHHDLKLNEENEIVSIYRDYKLHSFGKNKSKKDTLWGDGIVRIDTLGHVLKKWSAWDVWDVTSDTQLKELANDRFHFNSVFFDLDGNYIISTPIENQVWKVNKKSGNLIWKLGKKGDFKMNPSAYFYFQHAAHIDKNGDLLVFDNGDFSPNDTTKTGKRSRAISFNLDTTQMIAEVKINTKLPRTYYTARMGSSYLLPNDNILSTISKTGNAIVTDQKGKVLWVLKASFIPYRVEYIPKEIWDKHKFKN